jgi:hypothetical protein
MIQSKSAMKLASEMDKSMPRAAQVAVAIAGLWFLSFSFAQRLPFMRSDLLFEIRAFGIFPLAFGGLIWFFFLHRWAVSGKSGFRMGMEKKSAWAGQNQFVIGAGVVVGSVFFAAGTAWTCILIPAWCSQLFASTPMKGIYEVVAVKAVSNYREVTLVAQIGGEAFTLPLAAGEFTQARLKRGDVVCLRGRTAFTGAIVDSISKEIGSC